MRDSRPQTHLGKWLLIAAAVAFVAFVFYSLLTVEPIHLVSSRLERLNGRIFVQGEVTNRGRAMGAIKLQVHYYDANGRPLGEDQLDVDRLRPGEIRDFKSPAHPLAGVKDFTISLTHGPNPYGN